MITYIARHEALRTAVWAGFLMSLLYAGSLSAPPLLQTTVILLVPWALLFLGAIRRRLIAKAVQMMAFPTF